MSTSTNGSSGGVGVVGLLGVLFIGLKLTGYITWSWFWVLSPFWIGLALIMLLLIGAGIFVLISSFAMRKKRKDLPWLKK